MTQTYRTDDNTRWGAGKGSRLTPAEVDINFYELRQDVAALQATSSGAQIDYFSVTGTSFYVHMSDHTILGPYDLPVAAFHSKGDWAPSTNYSVLDTVAENGSVYYVNVAHTSALTFDANATIGGDPVYVEFVPNPGNSLPTGGATGQALVKSTSSDFSVTWDWKLPSGIGSGKVLVGNSSTRDDASWVASPYISKPPASPAGVGGQVPATADGTSTNMQWINVVYAPPPSPAGAPGYILATVDGTAENMEWLNPSGLGGGATTLAGLTGDVSITSPATGNILVYNAGSGLWLNKTVATSGIDAFLPTGGSDSFSLRKVDGSDYSVEWRQDVYPMVVQISEADLIANAKQYVALPFKGWLLGQTVMVQKTVTTGGTIDLNINGGSSLSGGQVTVANGTTPGNGASSSGITTGTSSQFVKGDRVEIDLAGFASAGRVNVTLLLVPRH